MMNRYRFSFGNTLTTLLFLGFSTLPNAAEHLSEFDQAIELTPNLENGRALYRTCATCHRPEGWGSVSGGYPQIAGQLPSVLIKQLADFRAGNRDNPIMRAFTSPRSLGGPQEIADVSAYVASLPRYTSVTARSVMAKLEKVTRKTIYQRSRGSIMPT